MLCKVIQFIRIRTGGLNYIDTCSWNWLIIFRAQMNISIFVFALLAYLIFYCYFTQKQIPSGHIFSKRKNRLLSQLPINDVTLISEFFLKYFKINSRIKCYHSQAIRCQLYSNVIQNNVVSSIFGNFQLLWISLCCEFKCFWRAIFSYI